MQISGQQARGQVSEERFEQTSDSMRVPVLIRPLQIHIAFRIKPFLQALDDC